MNAVVLGGGGKDEALARANGVPTKALVRLAGHPMAWYVLRALRDSGRLSRVAYVGPVTAELEALIDVAVPTAGGMLENLLAGLAALPGAERVLVATADVPMLTAEAVRDLLDRDPGASLVYPIVPRAAAEAAVPGGRRTYGRLLEGLFTGGNLFLVEPGLVTRFMPRLRRLIERRKNPAAMALELGPATVLKLVTGRLAMRELEATASRILGMPARFLVTEHAAIGADIDKPEDLALAARALEGRASGL